MTEITRKEEIEIELYFIKERMLWIGCETDEQCKNGLWYMGKMSELYKELALLKKNESNYKKDKLEEFEDFMGFKK